MTISVDKLKKLRVNHGWSQERLSELSGISLRTIQRIESGESVSLETQLAISKIFNVAPTELFENKEMELGTGGINWSGVCGIVLGSLMMLLQFKLPGSPFFDYISFLLVIGLSIAMCSISIGIEKTVSTISMIRWVIVLPNNEIGLENRIPYLNKLIIYCHTAGAISSLVGVIAVFLTPEAYEWTITPMPKYPILFGLGIALLTSLYAAVIAELVLRPLKHQIEQLLINRSAIAG